MATKAEISVIRSIDGLPADWDNYVTAHPQGRLFHGRHWLAVIEQTYRYACHGLVARDESGSVVGLLPLFVVRSRLTGNRLISAPFSYICGPLTDNDEIERLLLESAQEATRQLGLKYLEVKMDRPLAVLSDRFEQHSGFLTYRLDLTGDEEDLWRGLHKNMIQRGINRAKREGVTVEVSARAEDSDAFDYLNRVTCRKHGIPAQPQEFFAAIWKQLIPVGLADCLFARLGERRIAAVIIFYDRQRAIYMYGASLPKSLSARPNHLLLWEGILRAREKGMTEFDFGRVSADNTGLAEFKKRWGTTEVPLMYYYWPEKEGVGSMDRKSLKIRLSTFLFSRLPLGVTGRIRWLYRHLA